MEGLENLQCIVCDTRMIFCNPLKVRDIEKQGHFCIVRDLQFSAIVP